MDFATPRIFATARNDPDEIDDTYGTKLEIKTLWIPLQFTRQLSLFASRNEENGVEVKRARCRILVTLWLHTISITFLLPISSVDQLAMR